MVGTEFDVNDAHARRVLAVEVGCDPRTVVRAVNGEGGSLALRRAVHAALVRLGYTPPATLAASISNVPKPAA